MDKVRVYGVTFFSNNMDWDNAIIGKVNIAGSRMMKAAQISTYGDVSVIEVGEIKTPVRQGDKLLIEVHAASLNPFDTTVRSGKAGNSISLPITLGGDFAGIVIETAPNSAFRPGDKVFGQANAVAGNSGSFAEYTVTSEDQVGYAPKNLAMTDTASLPLVGVSALQALTEHLSLQAGQKLFIHGGAGGIGSVAIQLAKHIGAYVATTASSSDSEYVKSIGADEVIDYKETHFSAVLHDFDAVFDTVGGDDFATSLHILKRGGRALSMIAAPDEDLASELGVTAMMQGTRTTSERLNKLRELTEDGVVTPHVGKVYSLDEVREAFTARESGTIHGKVVLAIK